jgi:hypothetical protein
LHDWPELYMSRDLRRGFGWAISADFGVQRRGLGVVAEWIIVVVAVIVVSCVVGAKLRAGLRRWLDDDLRQRRARQRAACAHSGRLRRRNGRQRGVWIRHAHRKAVRVVVSQVLPVRSLADGASATDEVLKCPLLFIAATPLALHLASALLEHALLDLLSQRLFLCAPALLRLCLTPAALQRFELLPLQPLPLTQPLLARSRTLCQRQAMRFFLALSGLSSALRSFLVAE